MRTARIVLCAALAAHAFAASSRAVGGKLELQVAAEGGAPLSGARVELRSDSLLGARTAITGGEGAVRLLSLPPGSYEATVEAEGFWRSQARCEVLQNETTRLAIRLERLAGLVESAEVVEPSPIVETGTPKVSEHLDLEAMNRLPVPRDYRGYAQLVAGVNVVPNSDGLELRYEPASKAGNYYHDRGAALGSRDNQYALDGFLMTGMGSGGGDFRIYAGALAEQEVVTSGNPADLPGGAGYVVNLLTRSGGPRFRGTTDFYYQDPSMTDSFETDDSRLVVPKEDKWDLGLSAGGPVVANRLWFFVSGQRRENSDEVELSTSATPEPGSAEYTLTRDNLLGKLSWSATGSDTVTAMVFGENRESSGSRDVNQPLNRYANLVQEYRTGLLSWEHRFGSNAIVEARYGEQTLEDRATADQPQLGPPNTLLFPAGVQVPAYLRQLGSSGDDGVLTLDKRQWDLEGTLFLEAFGTHELSAGFQDQRWEEEVSTDLRYGVSLTSLTPQLGGITFAQARDRGYLDAPEYDTIFRALSASSASSAFATADANHDGAVSAEEFAALRFDSRVGNRDGVNFLRNRTVLAGTSAPYQRNQTVYAQDEWRRDQFSVLAGVRVEERSYFASDGSTILEMDPAWYPRLGVAWDVGGTGRHRLSLAWGVYPDPLRSSMIRFVGNLTGSIFADEVAIGDDWFSYRERGASRLRREAAFAPNLENEEEEEIQLSYGVNFSSTWGLFAQLYRREDKNLIEDYDPAVYFNPAASGDYYLPPSTFGYPPEGAGDVVFFLANLAGGKRVTEGLDLALTRRERDGWSATLQYSWKDARGNSNTDGAADLQGDFLFLDPRAPYMWGPLPGTIENQAKLFGAWKSPWRVEIGGLIYWNDGAVYTEATRHRPTGSNIPYNYRRSDGTFVQAGQEKHPGYTTVDLRFGVPLDFDRFRVDLSLSVLNALDNQDAIRVEESHNGAEFVNYGEPRLLLEPRRWQVGVRVGFE